VLVLAVNIYDILGLIFQHFCPGSGNSVLDFLSVYLRTNGYIPIIDAHTLRVPTRLIRDFCTFDVRQCANVSSAAICVSADNEVCRYIYRPVNILNVKFISLTDIMESLSNV
jgi:hypothetical protein